MNKNHRKINFFIESILEIFEEILHNTLTLDHFKVIKLELREMVLFW